MLGNTSDILDVVKSIFSSFSGLIFLLIGVFVGLYIFEKIIEGFMSLPASAFTSKGEKAEVGEFVKMAKQHGITFSKKNILAGLGKTKKEKRYQTLLKKYGDVDIL